MDRSGERGERGRLKALRQRLFGDRAAEAAVAVLERVDRLEPEMRQAGAGDRGQGRGASGRGGVEPGDEAGHLGGNAVRWGRFEMNARGVKRARDDLHRIRMRAIGADRRQIAAAVHQHGMPGEQLRIAQRCGPAAVEIRHQLGRAGLGRAGAPRIGGEAELAGDRGLQASAIEQLALDRGTVRHLLRHQRDDEALAGVAVEVLDAADDDARALEEAFFDGAQRGGIVAERGPVGVLPGPGCGGGHDR